MVSSQAHPLSMQQITENGALRTVLDGFRQEGAGIGFVPTMGALHEGHLTLVRAARAQHARVVVSIFVNPAQFGPHEDFTRYPRTLGADAALLEKEGVAVLYVPPVAALYPKGFATSVHVAGVGDHLCGPFRPGHFDGVATIVAKLLQLVGAEAAYFGEKDWQQLQLVKRMAADLESPTRIMGVPTVREADGLALSSRNRYLAPAERVRAASLYATLTRLAQSLKRAPAHADALLADEARGLTEAGFKLDYLEWADAETCQPVRTLAMPSRVFVAARLGATRLIDNVAV